MDATTIKTTLVLINLVVFMINWAFSLINLSENPVKSCRYAIAANINLTAIAIFLGGF